jgi:uncharacterized protein (TIGR00725 family)
MTGSYDGAYAPVVESDRRPRLLVAVVGPGDADAECLAVAEEVGRLLGEADATVLSGGLGGVMEAACRGASGAGATTVGILPGNDRAEANRVVSVPLATGLGEMRNALLVRCADAVIGVGGSAGTLSEIALAVRTGKPVVWVRGWDVGGLGVKEAATAEDAVALVLRQVGAGG